MGGPALRVGLLGQGPLAVHTRPWRAEGSGEGSGRSHPGHPRDLEELLEGLSPPSPETPQERLQRCFLHTCWASGPCVPGLCLCSVPQPPAVSSWPLGAAPKVEKASQPQSAESGSWVPAVYTSLWVGCPLPPREHLRRTCHTPHAPWHWGCRDQPGTPHGGPAPGNREDSAAEILRLGGWEAV